jgi:N-methylhydantoinase A
VSQQLAVDIGGTFVDAITFDQESGEMQLEKATTTENNPTEGVLDAIEKLNVDLGGVDTFIHGTTLGINAFLEREGAKTGIITNEGFSDVFEIGRYDRPKEDMYTVPYKKPDPLVKRRHRHGVPGRLDADGNEVEPLGEAAVRSAAEELLDQDVESVAVCFLHAYQNESHEQQAAEVIRETAPEMSVSTSQDITGEYREFERTSTTALDAYIKPIFESYVDRLADGLTDRGFEGNFFITRSGGGALAAENAKTAPVQTILSGPAGGIIGSAQVGDLIDRTELIAVDMGGTSLDACVIENGTPSVEYEASLGNLRMMIPVYDIRTIGAGGGSIAWLDGEILRVGPKSAGADPGPICYGQGGEDPTLTDAAVALGYIDPQWFLGGEMELAEERTRNGIRNQLADPLESPITDVSQGVFDVTLANTVGTIREITVEKGLDPREFSMVAYGGAGPMFVPLLARELDAKEVIIPQAPSVFSAYGMQMTNVVYDFTQTELVPLQEVGLGGLESAFMRLEEEAHATLAEEGFEQSDRRTERSVEMRYLGQEHTVRVPADDLKSIDDLAFRFADQHQRRYGHTMDDPAEAVHLRIRGIGQTQKPEISHLNQTGVGDTLLDTQEAYCFARDKLVDFDVYRRERLEPKDTIQGPAIVREATTTIVFHSDQEAIVDDYGHLIITGKEQ